MCARIIRLEPENRLRIEAPFGLVDLFALRLRPNSRRNGTHFARSLPICDEGGLELWLVTDYGRLVKPRLRHQALIGIALSDVGSSPCAQPP